MAERKNGEWWKGNFPTWIVVGLVASLCFFLKRELQINDDHRNTTSKSITELKVKVTGMQQRLDSLERATKENHDLLSDIQKRIHFPLSP